MDKNKEIVVLNLIVILGMLIFINKAYHVDDPAFLYFGRHITEQPSNPYNFVLSWGGKEEIATFIPDTPLIYYYISFVIKFFGEKEWIMHSFYLIFPIIAANSMYFLFRRFIKNGFLPSLLLIFSPTFFIMSHNIMLDIPSFALFLAALIFFIHGVDKNNHSFLVFSSIIAGLSFLAKPTNSVIFGLMLIYPFFKKKYKLMLYTLIPIFIVSLWGVHNVYFYGRVLFFDITNFFAEKTSSAQKILAQPIYQLSAIGGATIFPLIFLRPLSKKKNILSFIIILTFSILLSFFIYKQSSNFKSGPYTIMQSAFMAIFVSLALYFLWFAFKFLKTQKFFALNDSDNMFILAWFFASFFLNSTLNGGAVRYNVLLMVPLISLIFKIQDFRISNKSWGYIAIFTILLALVLAHADYEYAGAYRNFAKEINNCKSNNQIWFLGHQGFQYYMEKAGHRLLPVASNLPAKGDIIIRANLPSPRNISPELMKRIKLKETKYAYGISPLKIQSTKAHAGYYTYGGGFLPYSLSSAPIENFDIYEVVK